MNTEREKKYRLDKKRLLKTLLCIVVVFCVCIAAVDIIKQVQAKDGEITELKSVGQVQIENAVKQEDHAKDSASKGQGGQVQEDGFLDPLCLINWDHPYLEEETPKGLVPVEEAFSQEVVMLSKNGMLIDYRAAHAAQEMFTQAQRDGIYTLILSSAYRSQEYQDGLFQKKLDADPNYGSNPFEEPVSVMPWNRSEHVTGMALDITVWDHLDLQEDFAQTEEYQWLIQNCWAYGFILRYPEDKEHITGVVYEPWHFRYVGKEAALEMQKSGMCLEEYLMEIDSMGHE